MIKLLMKNIIEVIYTKDCIFELEFFLFVSLRENAKDIHIPLKKHHPKAETILHIFAISILGEINMNAYPMAQRLAEIHKIKNITLTFDFLSLL